MRDPSPETWSAAAPQEAKQRSSRSTWDGRALTAADVTEAEAALPAPPLPQQPQKREYSPEELDLLACIFTTVKLLYTFGALLLSQFRHVLSALPLSYPCAGLCWQGKSTAARVWMRRPP